MEQSKTWVLYSRVDETANQNVETFATELDAWRRFGQVGEAVQIRQWGYVGLWDDWPYEEVDWEPAVDNDGLGLPETIRDAGKPLARIGCDICFRIPMCSTVCSDRFGFEGRGLRGRWGGPYAINTTSAIERASVCSTHWDWVENIITPQIEQVATDQWLLLWKTDEEDTVGDELFLDELSLLRRIVDRGQPPDPTSGGYFAISPPLETRTAGESDLQWILRARRPKLSHPNIPALCPICFTPMIEPDRIRINSIEREVCQRHWFSVMDKNVAEY